MITPRFGISPRTIQATRLAVTGATADKMAVLTGSPMASPTVKSTPNKAIEAPSSAFLWNARGVGGKGPRKNIAWAAKRMTAASG